MDPLTVPVEFLDRRHLPKLCPYTGENGDLVPHRLEMKYIPWWVWGLRLLLVAGALYGSHHWLHHTTSHTVKKTNGIWVERGVLSRLRIYRWVPGVILVLGVLAIVGAGFYVVAAYPQSLPGKGWSRVIFWGTIVLWLFIAGALRTLFEPRSFRARLHSGAQYADLYFSDEYVRKAFATAFDAWQRGITEKIAQVDADYAAAAKADEAGHQDESAEQARKRRRQHAAKAFLKRNRQRRDEAARDPDMF